MESSNLPTLKQHIALILALLRVSPSREFYKLYGLAQSLVSRGELHSVVATDIFYFECWKSKEPIADRAYYYDRTINTSIGPKTMRWFVENHLIPMIELHLMITRAGIITRITLESVENLL